MCQEVGILTSTLASHKRSNPEKIEDLPHSDSEEGASTFSPGNTSQCHSQEDHPTPQLNLPSVNLPSLPPASPIPTYFPFPPSDCLFSDIVKTPGGARQSVLRCPTSLGYNCSPGVTGSRNILPAATPATSLQITDTTPQTLTWDNYRESPTFTLSSGWSDPAGYTLWSGLTGIRPSIASSTDPFLLDVSDSDAVEGIERLRSDAEEVRKVQLVSTDCSELSQFSLTRERLESVATAFEELSVPSDSETTIVMDHSKATKLIEDQQQLQDEIDDLDPDSITKDEALQLRQEVNRIWELKNAFRKGVRDLVAPLQSGDSNRVKWEQSCKEMVDRVIIHKRKVLTAIERVCPTDQMEFQRRSLELQEKAMQESRTVRKEQEEIAKKAAWAEAKVRLDTFRDQYNVLVAELDLDQAAVKDRDNVTVSQNMQDLQSWKKTFEKICTNYREYERIVAIHGEEDPAEDELTSAKEEFEAVKNPLRKLRKLLRLLIEIENFSQPTKQQAKNLTIQNFLGLVMRIM